MKTKEEQQQHRQMAMMRMHQRSHQPPYPSVPPRGLPHQPVPAPAAAARTIEQTTKPVNLDVVFKRKGREHLCNRGSSRYDEALGFEF
jgi:hypothetical protein